MTRSDYSIKDYEHKVNGRVLCKQHGLLRCSECAYVDDLEKKNKRYRKTIEETLQAMGMVDRQKYGKTLEQALEESE